MENYWESLLNVLQISGLIALGAIAVTLTVIVVIICIGAIGAFIWAVIKSARKNGKS